MPEVTLADVDKILSAEKDNQMVCKVPEGYNRTNLLNNATIIGGFDTRPKGYFFAFVGLSDGKFLAVYEGHADLYNSMDEVDPSKTDQPDDTQLNHFELRAIGLG